MSSFAYVDGMSFVFVAIGRRVWDACDSQCLCLFSLCCAVFEIEMCRHVTSESYDISGDLRDVR